jgi:hypothetical protein
MATPPVCPRCGSTLTLDTTAETPVPVWHPNVGGMPYVAVTVRRVTVAFCSGCEFAVACPTVKQ